MVFEKKSQKKKTLASELIDDHEINNLAVFPISIPLVAGPSAITLSILISKILVILFSVFTLKYFH